MGMQKVEALTFGGSEFIAQSLRIPCSSTIVRGQRKGVFPLKVCVLENLLFVFQNIVAKLYGKLNRLIVKQVVCVDYPRPELDNTVNFLEAASLSASFRTSARPAKPLKVVIAGAGDEIQFHPP